MSNQLLAPFRANQMNQRFYPGQSGYPTIQGAVTAAVNAGGGIVELQPGVSFTGTIGTVGGGSTAVPIVDSRVAPSVQYAWNGTNYIVTAAGVTPAGPVYAIQSNSAAGGALAGDAGFTRDASGNVNVVGKMFNLKKSDGTGTAALAADTDGVSIDVNGSVVLSEGLVAKGNANSGPSRATVGFGNGAAYISSWGASPGTYSTLVITNADSNGSTTKLLQLAGGVFTGIGIAFNSQVGFQVNGAAPAGQYLRGNGADFVASAIQSADVPTLNQNTTGTAANITGILAIANGGTGASTSAGALANLGVGSLGTQNANAVAITGGTIDGTAIGQTTRANGSFGLLLAYGPLSVTNGTSATSGANQSSPFLFSEGQYWNGTGSSADGWYWQTVLGAGTNPTSTYVLTHAGTPGNSTVSIPYSLSVAAISSNAGFQVNSTAPNGQYLRGNGTNFVSAALAASDITGVLAIANGGTGASTSAGALANLGVGSLGTQNANAVAITGGTIDGTAIGQTTRAAGSFSTLLAFGPFAVINGTPATSGANQSSPFLSSEGQYWNGTGSSVDGWYWQTALGAGTNPTSTYVLTHAGTPSGSTVSIPYNLSLGSLNLGTSSGAAPGSIVATGSIQSTTSNILGVGLIAGNLYLTDSSSSGSIVLTPLKLTATTTLYTNVPPLVYIDATLGNVTVTLPQPTGNGAFSIIKRIDNSSNTVTLAVANGRTFDIGTTIVLGAFGVARVISISPTLTGAAAYYTV